MTKLARGLGRGFDALIPQDFDASLLVGEDERVQKLSIDVLLPRGNQPRQHFDEESLEELASSIKIHGVLLPLVVTGNGDGTYRIVAGERRWRAAKLANIASLPVIVRTLQELEELEIALVENVQRVDLAPLEQAVSIERLHQQFAMPYEDIATRLGKAHSTVVNIVRLLQLPSEARDSLIAKRITEGHARAILALRNFPDKQSVLLANIEKHSWSVRQAERYVTSVKSGVKNEAAAKQRVELETPQTKVLSTRLKTPVFIRRTAKGGRLEISFKTEKELKRIIMMLNKQ